MSHEALKQVMSEYAQAIRGDWSEFDGRSERDVIEGWVNEIDNPVKTIEELRDDVGICPDGNGHWAGTRWGHCDELCTIQIEREVKR